MSGRLPAWLLVGLLATFSLAGALRAEEPLAIGSKRFTESYLLGEMLRLVVANTGQPVTLKPGLGNTGVLYAALRAGEIDLYPEYSGTISREILKADADLSLSDINLQLGALGLRAGVALGFNNAYVIAMPAARAKSLSITRLSDLAQHGDLVAGLSHEFLARNDGWPGLARTYGLSDWTPRGLDHGLAYEAMQQGQIDLLDAYGTDAKLARYHLLVLEDDRHFFPAYQGMLLYRADLPDRFPVAWRALQSLEGKLSDAQMRTLNAQAEIDQQPFAQVAQQYLRHETVRIARAGFLDRLFADDFARLGAQHLSLVGVALALSMLIGIPLGIVCFYRPRLGHALLGLTHAIQTIPSLALFAFLISIFGVIGYLPAIVALTLYALLPIMENTYRGLAQVPAPLSETATALGLSAGQRIGYLELPLALPLIVGGVKVSAVLSVGTATIAAFVGAGGFGERIAAGLALNDNATLLSGAIPAALLALAIHYGFWVVERRVFRRSAYPGGTQTPHQSG